jgi:hypothetical protein
MALINQLGNEIPDHWITPQLASTGRSLLSISDQLISLNGSTPLQPVAGRLACC